MQTYANLGHALDIYFSNPTDNAAIRGYIKAMCTGRGYDRIIDLMKRNVHSTKSQ
jgi:hypothetical protein